MHSSWPLLYSFEANSLICGFPIIWDFAIWLLTTKYCCSTGRVVFNFPLTGSSNDQYAQDLQIFFIQPQDLNFLYYTWIYMKNKFIDAITLWICTIFFFHSLYMLPRFLTWPIGIGCSHKILWHASIDRRWSLGGAGKCWSWLLWLPKWRNW